MVVTWVLASSQAIAAPKFSLPEQMEMNRATLLFTAQNGVGSAKNPACLALQGGIPAQRFLDSLGKVGKSYRPWPAGTLRGAPPCGLSTIIREYVQLAPDLVEAQLEQECGALCGYLAVVRLRKTDSKWTVDSMNIKQHY